MPKKKELIYYIHPLDNILSEEEACESRRHPMFPDSWETAITQLSRRYLRARKRVDHLFVGEWSEQALLVNVPCLGLAVVWRVWGETLEVVKITVNQYNQRVTFIPGVVRVSETEKCEFIVDRILSESPPWRRKASKEKEEE